MMEFAAMYLEMKAQIETLYGSEELFEIVIWKHMHDLTRCDGLAASLERKVDGTANCSD